MKRLLALAGAVVAALAIAAPASASASTRTCHSTGFSGVRMTVAARNANDCFYGSMIVDDLQSMHPRAAWTRGTRWYSVPRHGTDYRPGEDYHCRVTMRTRWYAAEQHPVARVTGACVYRWRAATRFTFDSGWFA